MHTPGKIQDDTKKAFKTLWSWLRRTGEGAGAAAPTRGPAIDGVTAIDTGPREPGIVLPFPIRGEALLVKLAELLRRRIAELDSPSDSLTLLLSHTPYLRLSLDDDAYIEFDAHTSEYDLVIEAPSGTRMIIQTTDFDSLVTFVLQYVIERLSDSAPLEVAS
jgi:hypothetical protein